MGVNSVVLFPKVPDALKVTYDPSFVSLSFWICLSAVDGHLTSRRSSARLTV